jgi:hypothetical protein
VSGACGRKLGCVGLRTVPVYLRVYGSRNTGPVPVPSVDWNNVKRYGYTTGMTRRYPSSNGRLRASYGCASAQHVVLYSPHRYSLYSPLCLGGRTRPTVPPLRPIVARSLCLPSCLRHGRLTALRHPTIHCFRTMPRHAPHCVWSTGARADQEKVESESLSAPSSPPTPPQPRRPAPCHPILPLSPLSLSSPPPPSLCCTSADRRLPGSNQRQQHTRPPEQPRSWPHHAARVVESQAHMPL